MKHYYLYVCDGCNEPFEPGDNILIVSDPLGLDLIPDINRTNYISCKIYHRNRCSPPMYSFDDVKVNPELRSAN